MNIFVLDYDLEKCAEYHVDKHVSKIILEVAQMLCSVQHVIGTNEDIPYKLAFKNHPCSRWARETRENYIWLCQYGIALSKEFGYRYHKLHKSSKVVFWCYNNIPELKSSSLTPFTLAMPDDVKNKDAVVSYREYYNKYKRHLFNWKNRDIPYWIRR